MRRLLLFFGIVLVNLTACGHSPEELAFQTKAAATVAAANWTETPTLTPTATFTSTPTLTPTSTFTPTPTQTPTITLTPSPTPFAGGGQIAFWDIRDSHKLYTANADGTNLKLVFNGMEYGYPNITSWSQMPTWSPTGRYFFFSMLSDNKLDMYLYDSAAGKVDFWVSALFSTCAWQIDESGLICSDSYLNENIENDTYGMYKISLTPHEEPVLIFPFDENCEAGFIWAVLSDNRYLVYTVGWDTDDQISQLVVVDDECNLEQTLYSDQYNYKKGLIKESTGRLIGEEFTFMVVDGSTHKNKSILYRYNFSNQSLETIFELDTYVNEYQFSPDGKFVALATSSVRIEQGPTIINQYTSNQAFQIMEIEGKEIVFMEKGSQGESICWSPDSQYVFYDPYRLNVYTQEKFDFYSALGISYFYDAGYRTCSP